MPPDEHVKHGADLDALHALQSRSDWSCLPFGVSTPMSGALGSGEEMPGLGLFLLRKCIKPQQR